MKTYYSILEAAGILGVSQRTIHQLVLEGRMAAIKVGSQWRIHADTLAKGTEPRKDQDRGTDSQHQA